MKKKTRKKITIVLVVLAFLMAGVNYILLGHGQVPAEQQSPATVPNFTELIFQSIILLGFIILLIYFILYLLKRFVYKNPAQHSNNAFEILSITPLIPKKSICVIKMVDRILVLGLTENAISPITQIDNPDQRREWEAAFKNSGGSTARSFSAQLEKIFRGIKK
ncbi:flagellar biosynthetic protein FliO [candidate division KSB1 bacterium]|nr:flagellar biosynthetic protein FliO [candidate division KSB1 bacterium]